MGFSLKIGAKSQLIYTENNVPSRHQQAFVVTVSDQHIQVKHAGQTQQITWAEIEHWDVGRVSLVIELPLRQAILLPFEAFENEAQRQAFEQQLSLQVGPARR
jgi:hypothetical protein